MTVLSPVCEDFHRFGVLHEAQLLCLTKGSVNGAQQLLSLMPLFSQNKNLSGVFLAEPSLGPVHSLQCATQILLQELVHALVLQAHVLLQLTYSVLKHVTVPSETRREIPRDSGAFDSSHWPIYSYYSIQFNCYCC